MKSDDFFSRFTYLVRGCTDEHRWPPELGVASSLLARLRRFISLSDRTVVYDKSSVTRLLGLNGICAWHYVPKCNVSPIEGSNGWGLLLLAQPQTHEFRPDRVPV